VFKLLNISPYNKYLCDNLNLPGHYLDHLEKIDLRRRTEKLKKRVKGQFLGIEMFNALKKYNIFINHNTSKEYASNLRLFEVTGMGACIVTDWRKNIADLFDEESEVVTYRNVEEAYEKIVFLLNNPKKMLEIAAAGQSKTLSNHTYENRAQDMHNILMNII
jgi:spore maturation protein CgeB